MLGDILGLWAHPDDEAYSSAGLMAAAVDAGHRVVCVTATHGEQGFPAGSDLTTAARKALRTDELSACLAVLGVTEHHFLGYPDGGCNQVADDDGAADMAAAIVQARPDTILTFAPDGGTGHPDHIALCRWVTLAMTRPEVQALDPAPRLLYTTKSAQWTAQFMTGVDRSNIMMALNLEPEQIPETEIAVHYICDEVMTDRKLAALRAQASQVDNFVETIGVEAFTALFRDEFFREPRSNDAAAIVRCRTLTFRT